MGLSFGKLLQLSTVARCGSISRAAEELHISQPALSRSIAALERQFGFQLFNRIGHGVEPSAAGAQVISQSEPLLQSMRIFNGNMALLAEGRMGSLQIGVPPLLASQLLADLARDFFAPGRDVELRISVRSAPALLDELKNDAIEFFLFADTQITLGPDVETTSIGPIRPTCVVRRDHPLLERGPLTTADLSAYPWASSVEPPALQEFPNHGRFLCDNYHVLRETVLQTDLVCICTASLVAGDILAGRMHELVIPGFLPSELVVHMAALKGRIMSPLGKVAVRRIRSLIAG